MKNLTKVEKALNNLEGDLEWAKSSKSLLEMRIKAMMREKFRDMVDDFFDTIIDAEPELIADYIKYYQKYLELDSQLEFLKDYSKEDMGKFMDRERKKRAKQIIKEHKGI